MQLSSETKQGIADAFAGMPYVGALRPSVEYVPVTGKADRFEAMGDPFNGPNSKRHGHRRRDVPVAAFAAVFAGTATVIEVAAVVAFAGTAMTVVGAVTGNQTLMKVGGVLSLAGGVVGLAAGAMSGAATAAGEAAGWVSGEALVDNGLAAGAAGNAAAGAATEWTSGEALVDAGTNGLPNANPNLPVNNPVPETPKVPGSSDPLSGTPESTKPLSSTPQASQTPGTQSPYGSSAMTDVTKIAPLQKGGTGILGWFNGLTPAQQKLVMEAVKTGGEAMKGLFAGWSEEEKMEFEREKFNLYQRNANAQPVYVANRPNGLLNSSKAA